MFMKIRGISMKETHVVGVVVLLATLLAMPGVSQSAMWAGAELGGNFALASTVRATVARLNKNINDVGFSPAVIGGATIGYDFVNSGFGAYAWPDWMKYFSFATDITYNRLEIPGQTVSVAGGSGRRLKGYEVAWTFLFMAHYGFFPDSVVPSGRVNPYIGVGPAILWSGLDSGSLGVGSAKSTNVALVVEPGIRWVAFPHVSIDTAIRYRYASPSWNYSTPRGTGTLKVNGLSQLAFLIRANYHF
jgi:hypothetical protein